VTNKRKLIIFSSILGFLIVIFIIGIVSPKNRKYIDLYEINLFSDLNEKNIAVIKLYNATGELLQINELLKKEDSWRLIIDGTEFPADQIKVDNFLEKVFQLETQRFVSENQKTLDELNIGDNGKHISFFDGNNTLIDTVYVGTTDNTSEEYVTTTKLNNQVYTIHNSLDFYINQSHPYWSQLKLFGNEITQDEILKITVKAENIAVNEDLPPLNLNYTLIQTTDDNNKSVWVLIDDDSELHESKINSLLNSIISFRADEFYSEYPVLSVTRAPIGEIEFTTEIEKLFSLSIMEQTAEDSFLCVINDTDFGYIIKKSNLARIIKSPEELREN